MVGIRALKRHMKLSKPKPEIYLGGGLFNAGQRLHILYLEKYLKELGYKVIVPQREALKHFDGEKFDTKGIVKSCEEACSNKNNVFVGCADGADADSGTCVEYAMAIARTGRAIVYRTDFRTAEDREVGINAMLKAEGTVFIYYPCYFTELKDVWRFYRGLAREIVRAIKKIDNK